MVLGICFERAARLSLSNDVMNLLFLPIACATCMPDPNSAEANAQGFAVLFMLSALALIFSVLFYTIFSFTRRQRQFSDLSSAT